MSILSPTNLYKGKCVPLESLVTVTCLVSILTSLLLSTLPSASSSISEIDASDEVVVDTIGEKQGGQYSGLESVLVREELQLSSVLFSSLGLIVSCCIAVGSAHVRSSCSEIYIIHGTSTFMHASITACMQACSF